MKLKKAIAMSLAVVTTMSLLTGCGGSKKEAEKSADGKKKLTISVWDNDTSPQFTTTVDAFMKKNPDVDVEIIDTQADEYDNKLTVMLAGGDADPDVIFVKNADTQATMQQKKQIVKLDDYIKKDAVDLGIYGGAGEQSQIDGSSYTMPYRKDWFVLFYNKDVFDKAGVPYPSADMTWDEYEALAKKMTIGEGSAKVYGSHNHTWASIVTNWAVQDGKNTLIADDYNFLKPSYERALRMQKDGSVQSYSNLKTGSIHYISVFEQGQCAMMPMGSWFVGNLISDKKAGAFNFNWGVTKIPHPEGMKAGSTVGNVTPVAINEKSDQKDLAWEFIKFATSEEAAELLAEKGIFPAVDSDAVREKLAHVDGFPEDGAAALEVESFVLDKPLNVKSPAVQQILKEEHDLIMIEEEDLDTGIKNITERSKEAQAE